MDRRKLNDKLAEPDFYLEWSPGIYTAIPNNDGPCKRYWAGREKTKKKSNSDTSEIYRDERLDKCNDNCFAIYLQQLAKLLWDSAILCEMTLYDGGTQILQVDLRVKVIEEMFRNAAEWFSCLAWLPYDCTFRIEALLDCLSFLMGWQYGKFQLECCYKIELLQLGFGFVNLFGRKQWVMAVESMLYNFNMQCKFMMPSKHEPQPLQVLEWFSRHRGFPEGMVTAGCVVQEMETMEVDKQHLLVLLRYFRETFTRYIIQL